MKQDMEKGSSRNEFRVAGPLYVPYHNKWGQLSYRAEGAFQHDPFELKANSTSGSPVAYTSEWFVGFLNDEAGGSFIFDGADKLEIIAPEGQELFVRHGEDPYLAWAAYNEEVSRRHGLSRGSEPDLYGMIEYCTWVEQKAEAKTKPESFTILTEGFVNRYLERLAKLDYPAGKFTIDAGWYDRHSDGGSGTFEPNRERFPDLERVARRIREAGHAPGIWLDLGCVSPDSRYFREHEEDTKRHSYWGKTEMNEAKPYYQALPGQAFDRQLEDTFRRLLDAGFVKFKLDMLYGNKREMKEIMKAAYGALKRLDPSAELEAHIPDLFVSRYCDVVRTNDVLIKEGKPWKELTLAHWTVCRYSSPHHVLNLDHIGGNDPSVQEEPFLEHLAMYDRAPGHPVVSLLPDRFSGEARQRLQQLLAAYDKNKNEDSYFTQNPKFMG